MTIRTANISDEHQVRQIHLKAFDEDENELVADLARDLLNETSTPETLHLVADIEGDIVGHIAFSPVRSKTRQNLVGYILAPLAIEPESQKKGMGSKLIREGLRLLAIQDVNIVFVYGDPDYYARFVFTTKLAKEFIPPFKLKYAFGWQAVDLGGKRPVIHSESIECVNALNKPELW